MAKKRLLLQLYPAYLGIALAALAVMGWYAARTVESALLDTAGQRLLTVAQAVDEAIGLSAQVDAQGQWSPALRDVARASGVRIGVLGPTGDVLFDSEHEPSDGENLGDRSDVRDALSGEPDLAPRLGTGIEKASLLLTRPVQRNGAGAAFVRVALPWAPVQQSLRAAQGAIASVALLLAAAAAVACLIVSRRASRPFEEMRGVAERFARGELGYRLQAPASEEMAGLAGALNEMARQLEDRLRTIVQQSNEQQAVLASMVEGVLAVDSEECVITLNKAAAELVGNTLADPLGRSFHEVVRNLDLQRFAARVLVCERPIEDDVILHGDPDRILQVRGAALRDAAGRGIGAVIVLSDVTHFRRLENIRRDFVANVSHELKTPITSIKGFVETLLDGALADPDDAQRFLRIVATQADRLNAIIEDLLSLSKIEQSERAADLAVEDVRLADVLDAVVRDCETNAQDRRIAVRVSCGDEIVARINSPLLEQAVSNLLDNAIKYSEQAAEVHVDVEQDENDFIISVSDQGCGIDAEHLPRLFERFYRVDRARSRKLGGTGLGLAIVKHIVQAHHGRVSVQSTPGEGSTFRIHLPISPVAATLSPLV
jgi:two-component system, OmpR family, phosphate regulon sensor histidine kinase PhoR